MAEPAWWKRREKNQPVHHIYAVEISSHPTKNCIHKTYKSKKFFLFLVYRQEFNFNNIEKKRDFYVVADIGCLVWWKRVRDKQTIRLKLCTTFTLSEGAHAKNGNILNQPTIFNSRLVFLCFATLSLSIHLSWPIFLSRSTHKPNLPNSLGEFW